MEELSIADEMVLGIIKRGIKRVKIKILISVLLTIVLSLIPNYFFLLYILPGIYTLLSSIYLNKLIKIKNTILRGK